MDRFGNYVIERELGRGGMGVVYAARHAILGYSVALKILHEEWAQREDVVQRFFNEARAATAIDHPGIVHVRDVGLVDGSAFIVMDMLTGESLAQRMRTRGPLPVVAAVAIARQIADVLAAAHAAGIVHRDLKPDNVFLVRDDKVVLLDFGVAKLGGDMKSDMRTKTGALLGTPHYMSPEQCDGERSVDHRSDLYSLGCVLFQMIAGRLPFEGGIGAVIGMHLHVAPPALRALQPVAPEAIELVVARLMAKDPAARFQTAAELGAVLDAWVPSPVDHDAMPRPVDFANAETLPGPSTDDKTVASIASSPPPPPVLKPPTVAPPSRRNWLLVGSVLVGVGCLALVVRTVAQQDGGAPVSNTSTSGGPGPPDDRRSETDALVLADAVLPDAPIDAPPDAKLAPRDAPVRVRDASIAADASSVAVPKGDRVAEYITWVPTSGYDWEISREYIVLAAKVPGDPGLARARDEARKAIRKLAKADSAIHLAIVDHAWEKGLKLCIAAGGLDLHSTLQVQCLTLACIADDAEHGKLWMLSYEPMLRIVDTFCKQFRK